MKKLISLLLAATLIFGLLPTALAAYDFSFVEEYAGLYEVDKNEADQIAFIDTISKNSMSDFSFSTPYESDKYYSYLYNDIIVLDYDTDETYSVWRLWVEYTGTQAIKADRITFTFDGKTFTFINMYDEERMDREENGDYAETYLIKFGPDCIPFIEALSQYVDVLSAGDDPFGEIMANGSITLTLHGEQEEITSTLPNMFLLDFDVILNAFYNGNGNLYDAANPTELAK